MEIDSPEIISGNHVTDVSGNPNEINSTNKKAAGNIFGGGGGYWLGRENSLSLTEFCSKLGEFCEKLGELHWHTKNRLKGSY